VTLRIEVGEASLASLDALRVEALALLVGPERPLVGLAGLADWRLCGALSRAIRSGHFVPELEEALLLPSSGRFPPGRVFCFGLPAVRLDAGALAAASRRVLDALARAHCRSFATSLPAPPDVPVARIWLEESLRHPVDAEVILGEPRALRRDLEAARQALLADAEIVSFLPHPEAAGAVLPPRSAVVR